MFEQYLITDNVQGGGLSVLSKTSGITKTLISNLDDFTIYEAPLNTNQESNPEIFVEACRYNKLFTATPMLMKISYLGKEVTTDRNRNYVAHTLISNENDLQGYAVDYFFNNSLFRNHFEKHEVDGSRVGINNIPVIDDLGLSTQGSIEKVVNNINKDIEFYKQLLQTVVLAVENNMSVKMVNYQRPLEILQMLYYVFPVKLSNLISFNTREYDYKIPTQKKSSIKQNGNEIFKTCIYGSVETIQFFNDGWSKKNSASDYRFVFINGKENGNIPKILDFIRWLTKNNSISADRIKIFKSFILDKKISSFKQLIQVDYYTLENYERNYYVPKSENKNEIVYELKNKNEISVIPSKKKIQKKRKFKLSILNILMILTLLSVGTFLISKIDFSNIKIEKNETYLVYEDGTKLNVKDYHSSIPEKWGYTFEGYVDQNGNMVIDKDGLLVENYVYAEGEINISCVWEPVLNKFIVDEHDDLYFECYTDEVIKIPDKIINALSDKAEKHSEFSGFTLIEGNGNLIFNKTSSGEYLFISPYDSLKMASYEEWINDYTIKLYPVYKTQTMKFTFVDYVTKKEIEIFNVEYDENGVVPFDSLVNNHPEYKDASVYIYNEMVNDYLLICQNNSWNGSQKELSNSNYDSGNITLYVSRQVKVFIGDSNKYQQIDYYSNLLDFAKKQLTNNDYKNITNLIFYKIDNLWYSANSSEEVWNKIGNKTGFSISPGVLLEFNFNEYNILEEKYVINNNLSAYSTIRFTLNYDDYLVVEQNICEDLKAKSLTLNGIKVASNEQNSWIYEKQKSNYKNLSNCLLINSLYNNFIVDNKEFNEDLFDDLINHSIENGNTINLYSVYKPEIITIKFGEINSYEKKVTFGEPFNNWKNNLQSVHYEPWGQKCVGWYSNEIELNYESSDSNVVIDFEFIENGFSSNGIQFEEIYTKYLFEITFIIDGNKTTYNNYLNDEIDLVKWNIKNKNSKDYYTNNYYNLKYKYNATEFSKDWYVNGEKNNIIDLNSTRLVINQSTLGDFVIFDNNTIKLTIEKSINYREYNILFDTTIYKCNRVGYEVQYSILTEQLERESQKYHFGDVLNGCDSITIREDYVFHTEYDFIGWKVQSNSLIEANPNITINDKILEELYQNKQSIDGFGVVTVKIAAVYEAVE